MPNVLVDLPRCATTGCRAAAIRGDYCVACVKVCESCRSFVGELVSGQCNDCVFVDCRNDMTDYVGQECVCGRHKNPPKPHASEVLG